MIATGTGNSSSSASIPPHHVVAEKVDGKAYNTPRYGEDNEGPLRVTLSIGGMTCSSCSTTVTTLVSDLQGASDVTVNLLGKSATVIVEHRKLVEIVVETVKDAGYEPEVISVESLGVLDHDDSPTNRSIAIRIDGMFCRSAVSFFCYSSGP